MVAISSFQQELYLAVAAAGVFFYHFLAVVRVGAVANVVQQRRNLYLHPFLNRQL
jgi:hypothetical protein